MKIVPAILTEDAQDFKNKILQAQEFCDFVQIDIMDGKFVPSKSVSIDTLSSINTTIGLEFHLMVGDPLEYLEAAVKSNVKRIIFHYEIKGVSHNEVIRRIRSLNMQVGLAINPATEINQVRHLLEKIDLLLLMAVNPGYYGSPFIPEVLEKSRQLSKTKHNFIIALDGGVKIDNILDIKNAGIDIACVGSGIFKGKGPSKNYRALCERIS